MENRATSSFWAWLLGAGIILIILGVLAIGAPFIATYASIETFGWLLTIAGVAQFLFSFTNRHSRDFSLHCLSGLVSLLIGILMITNPGITAATLTLLLAVFFLSLGLFRIFSSVSLRFPSWGWVFVGGLLSLILGILILIHWPSSALWVIGLFIGIELLFTGWSFVVGSIILKKVGTTRI